MNKFFQILLTVVFLLLFVHNDGLCTEYQAKSDSLKLEIKNTSGFLRTAVYAHVPEDKINAIYSQAGFMMDYGLDNVKLKTDIRFKLGDIFEESIADFDIRMFKISIQEEKWGIDIGRQIIKWGTTEGFNPTNNFCPMNIFNLSDDPSDQEIPNFILSAFYELSDQVSFQYILVPLYKSTEYRYDLIRPDNSFIFTELIPPPGSLKNSALAIKLQGHFNYFSTSVSIFNGYDPMPVLDISRVELNAHQNPTIHYSPTPFRKTCVGSDFEILYSPVIIRGEIGINLVKTVTDVCFTPNDYVDYVVNLESSILGTTLIIQYIGNHVINFEELYEPEIPSDPDPLALYKHQLAQLEYGTNKFNRKIHKQEYRWNHAFSFHLSKSFNYEQIEAQLSAYYSLNTDEWMLFPRLSWKMTDRYKLTTGYTQMYGREETLFAYTTSSMGNLFFELTYKF